jgi:Fe2+ or Zn2+ uptake regulation protein
MQLACSPDAFAKLFRSKGIKLTVQRRAIAEVIIEAKDHPSVNEIHTDTIRHPRILLATVYRAVLTLRDTEFVDELSFGGRNHDSRVKAEAFGFGWTESCTCQGACQPICTIVSERNT